MKSESQVSGERLAAGKDTYCHLKNVKMGK